MKPHHSIPLVCVSVIIAVVASHAALVLTGRIALASGRTRRLWLLGGALAMGTGIWSMHFVAMLAWRLPVPVEHEVRDVAVSLAVAVAASAVALYAASRPRLGPVRLATAGLAMGGGIAGMHYVGMMGMVTSLPVRYAPGRVALSVVVAVAAAVLGLWMAFHLRDGGARRPGWLRAAGAVVMGGAIAGMHYTGMWALRVLPLSLPPEAHDTAIGHSALAGAVTLATAAVLLLALLAAWIDRGSRTRADVVFDRITDGFLAFDPCGHCTYANRAAESLLGRTRGELLGRRVRDVVPDTAEGTLERAAGRSMARQRPATVESFLPALDRWVEAHVYPSPDGVTMYLRDASERRRADEALRRREQQLAEAQRIAHVGSWEWDCRTGEVAWSAETLRIFGMEDEGAPPTFRRFLRRVHPSLRAAAHDLVRRAVAGGTQFGFETRVVRPDGAVRVVDCQGGMVRDAAGAPLRFTGTFQDVTERAEAERRAREAAHMVDAVMAASPLAVIAVDPARRVTFWNPAAESMFGWTRDEVLGEENPIVPPGETGILNELVEAPGAPPVIHQRDVRRQRRDGSRVEVSVSAAPLHAPSGELMGAVSILADVSAARATQRQAQKMAERMRTVAAAAAATIGSQTLEALRDVICDAARRVLPFDTFTFATLLPDGAHVQYLGDFDGDVWEPGRMVALEGTPGGRAIRDRRSLLTRSASDPAGQGGRLWGTGIRSESCIRTPILTGDEVLGLITVQSYAPDLYDEHDVEVFEALAALAATALRNIRLHEEQNASQEALRRSREQLAQSQKMEAVGRLAGGVAHDFNNLLTVIRGNAEMLLQDRAGDAALADELGEVTRAADRAAALTRQLLAFSRQQVLQPRLLDLDGVVAGMHRLLSRLIAEDVDVVLRLDGALPSVRADPTQMEQVILNLAVNARDAMPGGGRMVIQTRALTLAAPAPRAGFELPAGSYVVLSVSDSGHGIPAGVMDRVFEPFFTTKAEGEGTGLGLATVYGIVKQSGGFIEASSREGRGTRFEIYLPSTPAPAGAAEPEAAPRTARGSGTVLLVEDNEAVRRVGTRALTRNGYTVLGAADGAEGLAMATAYAGSIDLVVTDVVMPRMGGWELARRLSESRPGTRIIFTSGFAEDAVQRPERFDAGAHFLPKPYGPEELIRSAASVLAG